MMHVSDDSDSSDYSQSPAGRHACGSRRHYVPCFLCSVIGFLLCLVDMKPRTKVILTWLYTFICACVTGSLVARYNHSNVLTVSASDMRKVDISTTFCESVTVKSPEAVITYKFYSEPKIGNDYTKTYRRVSTRLGRDEYQYWGYYLLKGSVISARVCGRAYLYRIVGKHNLDEWLDGYYSDSSVGSPILTKTCLSGWEYRTTFNETASKSEEYYFLFLNTMLSNGPQVNLRVDFQMLRKYYIANENDSTIICNSIECTVPLVAQSSESVVIYVPDNMMKNDITVTSYCKPRVYMYILVFGVLPFLIGTLITCAIIKCSRKTNRDRERTSSRVFTISNNENDRLQGFINENFQLQMSPPSYDEVQAFSSPSYNEAPPTYDEAVRNNALKELGATTSN